MSDMQTREEAIEFCMTFPKAYEDYPFDDPNWTVMRRSDTRRGFAWIFEKDGILWINVKTKPDWADFWRSCYASVIPAYHMNKRHWNSILLDGTVPEEKIQEMIEDSYELCGRQSKKQS